MSIMETTGTPPAVSDYAAAVRGALDDLDAHDVDELTGGLDADLLEQYRESGTVPTEVPAAYAAELRASAGFAARGSVAGPGRLRSWQQELERKARTVAARNPAIRAAWDFLVLLRPLWWVLRAWVLYQAVATLQGAGVPRFVFPHGLLTWGFFILCVLLSVGWSNRHLAKGPVLPRLLRGFNVVAAALSLLMVPWAIAAANRVPEYTGYTTPGGMCSLYDGVCHNGSVTGPLYVYGPDGTRINDVRFFDPSGSAVPIDLAQPGDPGPWRTAPRNTDGASPVPDGAGGVSGPSTPAPAPSLNAPSPSPSGAATPRPAAPTSSATAPASGRK
ncbi:MULTISPECIES: hypothetical protein [Arthrobacter]|uniref:Uncharacterized protein n=2 Tax=Arthrobacter TaxID=1663 RepID=A0ABU9KQY1_9MICC|nr:hypothetical protein [Arthrobacter sp. YJM1]MDP5228737.1 hypothetical protein [Arthrobacter sp. YJM1]